MSRTRVHGDRTEFADPDGYIEIAVRSDAGPGDYEESGERYSYVFDGNSQVLDQILVTSRGMMRLKPRYDAVHVNSEFADAIQASDHDPSILRFQP